MMQLVTTLFTGLAMGTTIILGQMIGGGKKKESEDVIGGSICFFLVLAVIVTVLMLIVTVPFAHLMQTPQEAFSQTIYYVRICSGGIIFIVAYNVLGSIFRGLGDSKTPFLFLAFSAVLNIALDFFCILVLHLGVTGAAAATVFSQAAQPGPKHTAQGKPSAARISGSRYQG